ncbi:MAG: LutB/LldF family L-lactate oxidation iron-sulfur protein [Bacteroidota bacterium]|nr:LutB/LldF family L-lactate oxidation iron-sulfur protein [Bacteroidota bacterium]
MTHRPTPIEPENIGRLIAERIHDPRLRGNLARATTTSLVKRAAVVADYDDWESMRAVAHDIKRHVLDHADDYLARFERQATAAGATVHFAGDAEDASRLICEIAARHGRRVAVKSKSMTGEEIDLTHALERAGLETIETDLGEYIIQLAEEPPSHITAPALHKSRGEIGQLFSEKLGIEYSDDPERLTEVARAVLREDFLRADVGVSGVNFAIAESGTLCIVENEGNARLSTTLPRVHIAVMGFEKLLPDFETLSLFLNLLGRSATGQRLTCYTSLITGPRRADEHDGPDELHIVILDNGRARLLADAALREALLCIRCGACLNVCPVYQKIGGHGYGSIYPGPIGSVITPIFRGETRAAGLPFASSLCGACADICPVHIDLHHLLLTWRARISGKRKGKWTERLIMWTFVRVAARTALFDLAGRLLRVFGPLLRSRDGGLRVPIWSDTRTFPAPPPRSFKQCWRADQERPS